MKKAFDMKQYSPRANSQTRINDEIKDDASSHTGTSLNHSDFKEFKGALAVASGNRNLNSEDKS